MKIIYLAAFTVFCCSPVQAFNFPERPTKSYECNECSTLSRETIEDTWEISNKSLNDTVSNLQKSYSYKEQITAKQLQKGVVITTLAPGAVVRITPLQNKSLPQLQIKPPAQPAINLKDASALYSDDEPLIDSLLFTQNQIMVQIKPELGFGKFILKSKQANTNNAESYMINVLDKFSTTHLNIKSKAFQYQYGDKIIAQINLTDDDVDYAIDDIHVTLIGPLGENIPLEIIEKDSNLFEASIELNSAINVHGENWYIEANVETEIGTTLIKRSAHTAFSYSIPSATLTEIKKLSSKPLTFQATINVATASRYSLQSVLFSKEHGNGLKPRETTQKAQWLESGRQIIQFTFDNSSQLSEDSLYLGYLRLIDYGQLKTVDQYNPPIKLTQLVE